MCQAASLAVMMHIKADESLHGLIDNCHMWYIVHQMKYTGYIDALAINCTEWIPSQMLLLPLTDT